MRISTLILAAASSVALAGCAYGDLGYGLGYGSGNYGYGAGYGSPYGYGGYGYGSPYYGAGYGYGSPYGYGGFGSPYYGWNNNYYYPGTGYYVYDTYRRPHVWTDAQRNYWTQRIQTASRTGTKVARPSSPNWSAFDRQQLRAQRQQARADRQQVRVEPQATRATSATIDRPSRSVRLQNIEERRSQRLTTRSSRSRDRTRPITKPD
jgi:hypothetical protein